MGFAQFGNDLYTGQRSFGFIGRRALWYAIAIVLIALTVLLTVLRGGFNLGIEFRGGSEFRVSDIAVAAGETPDQTLASDAVRAVKSDAVVHVAVIGTATVRAQTDQLSDAEVREVSAGLIEAYGVSQQQVTSSFVGASWGADVTGQALRGLVIFVILVSLVMALYFRTWKMALAALIAMVHDILLTVGVYGVLGFEITPAAMIGFLTILGYSLYDTVVVFDKVRENTAALKEPTREQFREKVNLAVNQTLVRSINTSVVAVLPVAAILFIGSYLLGAGTLRDISLALFVGMLLGTYSTIFIAAPVYSHLREREFPVGASSARPAAVPVAVTASTAAAEGSSTARVAAPARARQQPKRRKR